MRAILITALLAACSKSAPPPPTERELAKTYEAATTKALLAKWSGLEIRVGDRLMWIVAASCKDILPVVQAVTEPPPEHQIVECGTEVGPRDWRLIEHLGVMAKAVQ